MILSLWLGLSAGCSDQTAGVSVRMPADRRPDLDAKMLTRGSLTIPGDQPFNYPKFRSGQEGDAARGAAKAIGEDGAGCSAEVEGEGVAWGEFVLAYCFDNMTDKTLDAVVRAKIIVHQSVTRKGKQDDVIGAAATKGSLIFYIEDASAGHVLKQRQLISAEPEQGPQSSTTRHDLVFDVKLEPGRGYYLVFSGRADVRAEQGQDGGLQIEVSDVSLDIHWQVAASSVRTDADDAGHNASLIDTADDQPPASASKVAHE